MNHLLEALKAKYRTPQEALAALGIDEDVLAKSRSGSQSFNHTGAFNMGKSLSKKAVMAKGALLAVLKPQMMAADSMINLDLILQGVKRKNWLTKKPGIVAAVKPHLAKDADLSQIIDLLDQLDSAMPDAAQDDMDDVDAAMDDKNSAILDKLRGKISDDDLAEISSMLLGVGAQDDADPMDEDKKDDAPVAEDDDDAKEEVKDPEPKAEDDQDDEKDEKMDKAAMDSAIKAAVKEAEKSTVARLREIAAAEEAIRPYVGKLTAMDSAEDYYKAALGILKKDVKGVHPSAYKHILLNLPNPNEPTKRIATDSSLSNEVYECFPALAGK